MSNLKYWLWLSGRKHLAGQNVMRVLAHFGTPERIYFSDEDEYRLIPDLSEPMIASLKDKSLDRANQILGDCDRLEVQIMTMQDSTYPERLAAIHQPPLVLYQKGRQVAFDEEVAIAIVGSRGATGYGLEAATRFSVDLVQHGALVVTGMAQGIDAAAIRGALKAGGHVVSVLAGGLDVVYPREHRDLYADVAAVGTLLTEYPPGTEHHGGHFPVRNRIISGLSLGVIAVEAKRESGTMHTVRHALEQDRDVFAVPGPIGSEFSEGTNRLIQEGAAKLIMSADDVLCEYVDRYPHRIRRNGIMKSDVVEARIDDVMAQVQPSAEEQGKKENEKMIDNLPEVEYIDWIDCKNKLTEDQMLILSALTEKTLRIDDLVEVTQIPARRILSAMTILQLQGYVAEESGKRFRAAVRLKME